MHVSPLAWLFPSWYNFYKSKGRQGTEYHILKWRGIYLSTSEMAFDPSLIMLVAVYTDAYTNKLDTHVYANDLMQARVFFSVNYKGDADDATKEEIKNYVQDNGKFLELTESGDIQEVSWYCSKTSGPYEHEISDSYSKYEEGLSEMSASDIRAPLYCTVPVDSEGYHKWIGELDDIRTSTSTPVNIRASLFYVESTGDDLEFRTINEKDKSVLRALMYKSGRLPDNQQLLEVSAYGAGLQLGEDYNTIEVQPKMVMFAEDHSKAALALYPDCYDGSSNCMIIFPKCRKYEYGEFSENGAFDHVADYVDITKCDGFNQADETLDYDPLDVSQAFKLGIPMFGVSDVVVRTDEGLANFELDVEVIDNYGNFILLEIDWSGKESESGGEGEVDYWTWTIQKATIQL